MNRYKTTTKELFLKSFAGLIFYFAIINIIVYFQRGSIPYIPVEWLLNPIYELLSLSVTAWITLIICEMFSWVWMIVPKNTRLMVK